METIDDIHSMISSLPDPTIKCLLIDSAPYNQTSVSLVGRTLDTNHGPIYFSWVSRCLIGGYWCNYQLNGECVEITRHDGGIISITLIPKIVEANSIAVL